MEDVFWRTGNQAQYYQFTAAMVTPCNVVYIIAVIMCVYEPCVASY